MATNDARGTKLTCQNDECGARFYDLNREPAICPMCATVFVVEAPPEIVGEAPEPEPVASKADEGAKDATAKDPDTDVADELADIETDDALTDDDDKDTFLVEADEDENASVTDMVGGTKGAGTEDT